MWWPPATGRSLDDHSGWCESACRTLTRHRSKRPSQRLRRERAPRFAMLCHIPGSRASNLRLQRKSLDSPELVLVHFALRHESMRSRTAQLGKGVAKDCSFAISKIDAGIEMTSQNKTGLRARNWGSRINSEGFDLLAPARFGLSA